MSSGRVPLAAMRPPMMMPARSHTFSTRLNMCVDKRMVLPWPFSSTKKSVTTFAVSTSRPFVGSSKMMTSGSCTSDTASDVFCFMPVDRSATFVCANRSMPKRPNSALLRSSRTAGSTWCSSEKKSNR